MSLIIVLNSNTQAAEVLCYTKRILGQAGRELKEMNQQARKLNGNWKNILTSSIYPEKEEGAWCAFKEWLDWKNSVFLNILKKRETNKAKVFNSRDRAAAIIHLHTFKHSKKRSADVRSQLWRILELNFSGAQKNTVIDWYCGCWLEEFRDGGHRHIHAW